MSTILVIVTFVLAEDRHQDSLPIRLVCGVVSAVSCSIYETRSQVVTLRAEVQYAKLQSVVADCHRRRLLLPTLCEPGSCSSSLFAILLDKMYSVHLSLVLFGGKLSI